MAEVSPQVAELLREKEMLKARENAIMEAEMLAKMGPVSQWRYGEKKAAAAARGAAAGARRPGKFKKMSATEARRWIRQFRADWPQLGLTEADVDDRGPSARFMEVLHAQGYTIGHPGKKSGSKKRKSTKRAKKSGSKPRKGSKAAHKAAGKKAAATRKRNHAKRSAAAKKGARTRKSSAKPRKKSAKKRSGGRKKARSPKQKANDRRLGRAAKARAKK